MDQSDSYLTWGFRYNPLLAKPNSVFVAERDSYPFNAMAADRSGSYLAPCYWPSPYNGPYGVNPQHSTPVNPAKRSVANPCECSACVTTTSQTFKPVFAHSTDSLVKNQSVGQVQPFAGQKEISQSREVPDAQNYNNKAVSPPRMCIPTDPIDSIGPRRGRTVFTAQQLQVLERVFVSTQYIVGSQRKFLANQLRLSETQVRVWFQNRRIKWRKQMLTRSINS